MKRTAGDVLDYAISWLSMHINGKYSRTTRDVPGFVINKLPDDDRKILVCFLKMQTNVWFTRRQVGSTLPEVLEVLEVRRTSNRLLLTRRSAEISLAEQATDCSLRGDMLELIWFSEANNGMLIRNGTKRSWRLTRR